ncbi:MAG: tetratricopeptide repeat protein [Rhodospirillales bacterium]|nr:MAG: tetratricopeptide repeat protein [Rhodospirillales bacterium]
MTQDAQGNAVSGGTPDAVERLDQAIRAFTIGYGDAMALLDAASAVSPDMPMALIAKAWIVAIPIDPRLAVMAAGLAERARALPLNERERSLLGALDRMLTGERRASITALEAHLLDHPRDLLAHYAAFYCDALLGRFPRMRERAARALPYWSSDTPGFAVLRAARGFALEEAGCYAEAEEDARAAIALEPHLYFAHHGIMHCMEMTGRPKDGLAWSREHAALWASAESGAQGHLWWHTSLFHVELDQFSEALELYDGPLMRTIRPIGFAVSDPAALLWRLDTMGCDVGRRWNDLLPRWEGRADGRHMVFTDMHAAMTELRSGNEALAEARLSTMRQTAAGTGETAALYREVGLPLVEAIVAFHRGAYDDCVELLFPLRPEVWRIGGSIAQRDIVDWTLTTAALRAGRRALAWGLTYERLAARPESLINRRFQREAERLSA